MPQPATGHSAADAGDRVHRPARGRGGSSHRTEGDVSASVSPLMFLPSDSPGLRIVLSSAIVVISEKGFHGTSVRDIADHAGMSPGSMYHYFESKQDLLHEILRRGMVVMTARARDARDAAPTNPIAQFEAMVRAHVVLHTQILRESLLTNRDFFSLSPDRHREIVILRDEYEALFVAALEAGLRNGSCHFPHAGDAVRAVLAMCSAVANWYSPDGPLTPGAIADRYTRLALNLIEVEPGRR
ncbi:MAG TPA: TetR/AcrR family transcriptional regulator [Pseudonocardia sp.]|nr:TetR/AcrR family transcriptional regulator [Pseudonocardia sp.]